MRYVNEGGVRISAIGLGTWQFGAREWGYGDDYAHNVAPAIVARALELGINLIDTAEMYGFGRSERIVGRAIKGHSGDVFVATKLFPVLPLPPVVEWRAIESAARLGVDHIDLYQVHWPNPLFAVGLPMRAMAKLQMIGLVRNVGVSNFSLEQWGRADRALGRPVLSNQVQFSLAVRRHGDELVPWAEEHDRIVIAYSPLAQGLLSGRYDKDHLPHDNVRRASSLFLPENLERAATLLGTLREIADGHDATSAQVALAWLIRRPNVVAIPGASSVAQVASNAAAADLQLTDEEDQQLTAESDRFSPRTDRAAAARIVRRSIALRKSRS
jgi:aryl-alcohol dehydrogenase-like predicted oxidoreductase